MTNKKKTNKEWQCQLTSQEYHITREGGTETPFTNKYYHHYDKGVYQCVCCNLDLFISNNKFHSGSGWPSYNQPINDSVVKEVNDISLGMMRTEVKCSNCDAHLGHVFPDNSQHSGKRY